MALTFGDPVAQITTAGGATLSEPFEIAVNVQASKPTKISYASVTMLARWGHHNRRWTSRAKPVPLTFALTASEKYFVIPQGLSTLRATVVMPRNALPSVPNAGMPVWSQLLAVLQVKQAGLFGSSIGTQFFLKVGAAIPQQTTPVTAKFLGSDNLPVVRLQHTALIAGSGCQIELTLPEPAPFEITVTASLWSTLQLRHMKSSLLATEKTSDGAPRPIGKQTIRAGQTHAIINGIVPPDVLPTCGNREFDCQWKLVVDLYAPALGTPQQLAIPVQLVGTASEAIIPDGYTAAEHDWFSDRNRGARLRRMFAQVASERAWRVSQLGNPNSDRWQVGVHGTTGDFTNSIEYRAKDTHSIHLQLSGFKLGLGLTCTGTAVVFQGRHLEQIEPFKLRTVPLARRLLPGKVHFSDEQVAFEQHGIPVDLERLRTLAHQLVSLEVGISTALAGIAPPPDLQVKLSELLSLAGEWEGQLCVGDASIHGTNPSRPVTSAVVRTKHGAPIGVVISCGSSDLASDALRAARFTLRTPSLGVCAGDYAPDLAPHIAARLAAWPTDFVLVRLADGVASAMWQFAESAELPVIEVDRLRELYQALRALLDSYSPSVGPYR